MVFLSIFDSSYWNVDDQRRSVAVVLNVGGITITGGVPVTREGGLFQI